MSKFKIGDKVVLIKSVKGSELLKKGVSGIVLDLTINPYVQFDVNPSGCLHNANGRGEDGKCWAVSMTQLRLINETTYQNSKRHKLHQAIKKTGHTATDLSIASGHGKFYFSSEAKESRFNSRGDLSDKQYNNLITNLAVAERKLNEIPALTVEDEKQKVLTLDSIALQHDYQRQAIIQLTKQQTRKRIAKSKTEVNKKTACFILFLISVVFIFVVTGVVKGILP